MAICVVRSNKGKTHEQLLNGARDEMSKMIIDAAGAIGLITGKGGNIADHAFDVVKGMNKADQIVKLTSDYDSLEQFKRHATEDQLRAMETIIVGFAQHLGNAGWSTDLIKEIDFKSHDFLKFFKAQKAIKKWNHTVYKALGITNILNKKASFLVQSSYDRLFKEIPKANKAFARWNMLTSFLDNRAVDINNAMKDSYENSYKTISHLSDDNGKHVKSYEFSELVSNLGDTGGKKQLAAEVALRFKDEDKAKAVYNAAIRAFDEYQKLNIGMTSDEARKVVIEMRNEDKDGKLEDLSDSQLLYRYIQNSDKESIKNSFVRFVAETGKFWKKTMEGSDINPDRIGGEMDANYIKTIEDFKPHFAYIPSTRTVEKDLMDGLFNELSTAIPGIQSFLKNRQHELDKGNYIAATLESINGFRYSVAQVSKITLLNSLQEAVNEVRLGKNQTIDEDGILKSNETMLSGIEGYIDMHKRILFNVKETPDTELTKFIDGLFNSTSMVSALMLASPAAPIHNYGGGMAELWGVFGFKPLISAKKSFKKALEGNSGRELKYADGNDIDIKNDIALVTQKFSNLYLESMGKQQEFLRREEIANVDKAILSKAGKWINEADQKIADWSVNKGLLGSLSKALSMSGSEEYLRSHAAPILYQRVIAEITLKKPKNKAEIQDIIEKHSTDVFEKMNGALGNFGEMNKGAFTWAIQKYFKPGGNLKRPILAIIGSRARLWGAFRMVTNNHIHQLGENVIRSMYDGNGMDAYFKDKKLGGSHAQAGVMFAGFALAMYNLMSQHDTLLTEREDLPRVPMLQAISPYDDGFGIGGRALNMGTVLAAKSKPFRFLFGDAIGSKLSEQEYEEWESDAIRFGMGVLGSGSVDKTFRQWFNGELIQSKASNEMRKSLLFATIKSAPMMIFHQGELIAKAGSILSEDIHVDNKYEAYSELSKQNKEIQELLGANYPNKAMYTTAKLAQYANAMLSGRDGLDKKWLKAASPRILTSLALTLQGANAWVNPELYDVEPYRNERISYEMKNLNDKLNRQLKYGIDDVMRDSHYAIKKVANQVMRYNKIFVN